MTTSTRVFAVVLVLGLAALPSHSQSSTAASLTVASTNATITSFAGGARVISAETSLLDRDTIATGLKGSALVSSVTGWTASLAADTRAAIRTEAVSGGPAPVFARVLELLSGSLTWKVARGSASWLRTPAGLLKAADAATINISFADNVLTIQSQDGTVELVGNTADVKLKGGQWVRVHFSPRSNTFSVEIIEDNGNAIDIEIGKTLIHATKGDAFEVQIQAGHADVRVTRGLVQVSGPDRQRMIEVGPGQTETVVNGGEGAIRGETPKGQEKGNLVPKPRNLTPFGNQSDINITRTDVSPS
jgi:ferric-dicitrate binding protein FerR (iron transport regulator)